MAQYLPPYGEVLAMKAWMSERGLPYVHFHDGCGYSWFEFDDPDDAGRDGIRAFWAAKGKKVSFREDGRTFIVTEEAESD